MSSTNLIGTSLGAFTERWWVPVVRGVAAIVFGVLALAAPSIGLFALSVAWAAYAITDGISTLVLAAGASPARARVGWYVFEGIVSIVAGVATLVYPGITALALVFVMAGWAVLTGIVEIGAAIEIGRLVRGAWLLGVAGFLSIAFGGAAFASPAAGALALVWLIATYAIVFGGLGLALRRLRRDAEGGFPIGRTPSTV